MENARRIMSRCWKLFSKLLSKKLNSNQKIFPSYIGRFTMEDHTMTSWKWSQQIMNLILMLFSNNPNQVFIFVTLEMITGKFYLENYNEISFVSSQKTKLCDNWKQQPQHYPRLEEASDKRSPEQHQPFSQRNVQSSEQWGRPSSYKAKI